MQPWTDEQHSEPMATSGKYLSADEIGAMVRLLREVRDLTLSRRTFATASELIARFTGESDVARVVRPDVLDG